MAKRYKYLGRKVKDRGKQGLDRASEYRDIAKAVVQDYKKRRISKKTARGRLALLLLLLKRNRKFKASRRTKARIRAYIRSQMRKL